MRAHFKYFFLLFIVFFISNPLSANEDTVTPPEGYIPVIISNNNNLNNFANGGEDEADVLLIQTALPWNSDANTKVLDQLGYTYKSVDMSEIPSTDITDHQVVLIVNDQNQAFYDNYATNYSKFENYVKSGGTLVFFAVDRGWASGNNQTDLPGGVKVEDRYENYNVISKSDHPIISEELTQASQIPYRDGALSNDDLLSNYASHNYFPTPPEGATILLKEKENGQATLMIYSLGKGNVIASGLTWEHSYARYAGRDRRYGFGRALPDLFKYAFNLAGGLEKKDVSVFLYPEDQDAKTGREKLWKHPGDIFDVVAQIDNNSGEAQSDVSLTFKVDASVIDSNQPVYVYRRNQLESVDRGENLIKLVQGQDYTVDLTGKVALTNLTIIEGDNIEFVLRFRITEAKQSRSIDVQATISSDVVDSTSKLSDGGPVVVTGDGHIILTNRTLFYKYFAKDKSKYSYGRIKQLWETLYKVAASSRAVISYVDKYDQDYDGFGNGTPTIDWLTARNNIAYDADYKTGLNEEEINKVANKIAALERSLISKSGESHDRHVAVLGGDEIIPFYRLYDSSQTVLNTCRDKKLDWKKRGCKADTSSHVAGEVTLKDTLNGYLLTDGIYRVNEGTGIWKTGGFSTKQGIGFGRVVSGVPSDQGRSFSLNAYIRLLKSSNGIVGKSANVIKLENAARDKELDTYTAQAIAGAYNVVTTIDGITLDKSVVSDAPICPHENKALADQRCGLWYLINKDSFPIQPDDAHWSDLRKIFEGTSDIPNDDFALMRFMTHGSVDSISSSSANSDNASSDHKYATSSNLKTLTGVNSVLEDINPVFVGDACLIGLVENDNTEGLTNLLSNQYAGGVYASSAVTWTTGSSKDISGFNDIITDNLFSGVTTGKSLMLAMAKYDGIYTTLTRSQMNLFGLPWARLAKQPMQNANQQRKTLRKINSPVMQIAGAGNLSKKIITVDNIGYVQEGFDQYDFILISGYELLSEGSDTPALPFKTYKVNIPANATDVSVLLNEDKSENLGKLNIPGIQPPPPIPDWADRKSGVVDLVGVSGIYPSSALSYKTIELGSSKLINITLSPVKYNIDTKDTRIITKGEIVVQYTTPDKGVVKSMVTDKYVYKSEEGGVVTASMENTSAVDAVFTVDISILDLTGAEINHETKSVTIPVGGEVEQQVNFNAPLAGGHYRVKISVSDGGATNIGESFTNIRVVAKEITLISLPEKVIKKEITTIHIELNNYTADSYDGVLKLDVYSIDGDLIASLPSKNITLTGNGKVVENYPWTPNESFSSGTHYVKGVFSITNDETLIANSDEFILQGDEDISLSQGWNLVSFPVTPDVSDVEQTIAEISGSVRTIWSFNNNQWKSFDPNNPNFSTLTTFESGVGYWFDMRNTDVLEMTGTVASSTVNLVAGWNLIGYPLTITKTVSEVMTSIDGKFDSVWGYVNGQWKSYDANQPNFSSLTNFKPKSGYWIKAKESVSLSF